MLCKALKDFVYSRDGVTPQKAHRGGLCDIPPAMVGGLVDAGYIDAPGKTANKMDAAPVETGAPVPVDPPKARAKNQPFPHTNVRPAKPGPTKQAPPKKK